MYMKYLKMIWSQLKTCILIFKYANVHKGWMPDMHTYENWNWDPDTRCIVTFKHYMNWYFIFINNQNTIILEIKQRFE